MNPSTGIDTAAGKISPTIRYKLPNDEIYVTYPENNPTIILFVAHWCPYCQEEIPEVIKWIEEDGVLEKGLSVLLVVTSTDSSKPNYPLKIGYITKNGSIQLYMMILIIVLLTTLVSNISHHGYLQRVINL